LLRQGLGALKPVGIVLVRGIAVEGLLHVSEHLPLQ
jgi:hypothetical protein